MRAKCVYAILVIYTGGFFRFCLQEAKMKVPCAWPCAIKRKQGYRDPACAEWCNLPLRPPVHICLLQKTSIHSVYHVSIIHKACSLVDGQCKTNIFHVSYN